ncbi:MAG: hypothetical protein U9R75_08085, partial [Candidatus Thermoplasmatota archaeon]|nr:hypothetical protein [Candidatus Thermoplasmatota archaeon]
MSEGPAVSPSMAEYFTSLKEEANRAASIAREARSKGFDPTDDVEIPFADDLAGRVEKLVGPKGVAKRIRELSPTMSRERLLLLIAQEVARDLISEGENKQKALDQATRTGLAILTEGVLVAPLEGIADVKIGTNSDGSSYADLYFAGPIRAAGGTAQAVSVLIADQVRRSLGIDEFKVTEQEVSRYVEEFQLYRNLQYKPSNSEIERVVRNCPVCINGEGTEKVEVQGNRDLPRVSTNQVRSGICLVIAEGVLLKAKKILKITKSLEIKGWEFLEGLKKKKEKGTKKEKIPDKEDELLEAMISMKDMDDDVGNFVEDTDDEGNYLDFTFDQDDAKNEVVQLTDDGMSPKVEAAVKYIKDLIAGRPVFSHPSRPGGFRLRYGRSRTCGLASIGVNPYTLFITGEFMATGTQIKIERPGKAGAVTPVDSIEGPIVLLESGDLVKVDSREMLDRVKGKIKQITDVGDILIPFGEFAENNHALVQGCYNKDWWSWEVQTALFMKKNELSNHPFEESFNIEKKIKEIKKRALEPYSELISTMKGENSDEDIENSKKLLKKCEETAEKETNKHLREAAERAKKVEEKIMKIDISSYIPKEAKDAVRTSKELGVPLHPEWTMLWHDIDIIQLGKLRNH